MDRNPLLRSVAGIDVNYAAFQDLDSQTYTLLWAAEHHGVLAYLGQVDGDFLVTVRDVPFRLHNHEIHGFVLGVFAQAGLDITPVAYRTGLTGEDTPR